MDVDEDRIGMVLVRASTLRSKIANCVHKASLVDNGESGSADQSAVKVNDPSSVGVNNEGDGETETLLTICDAFESLESQLATLQDLHHQQLYERETVIAEIEYCRKMLLKKLNEYRGETHQDVVAEAILFARTKLENNNVLLLPPYPRHGPHSLVLDASLPHLPHGRKSGQNGHNNDITNKGNNKNVADTEREELNTVLSRSWRGMRFLAGSAAKSMVTLVAVVSVLALAGFETKVTRKKGNDMKVLDLFQVAEKMMNRSQCPPGKVAVLEDGEMRCVVKERVEVPFDFVRSKPDVDYGCG